MILYKDIVEFDIVIMKQILQKHGTDEEAWRLFCHFYVDPDGYPINEQGLRTRNGVECTADTIISTCRIRMHEGFNEQFINTFAQYRRAPMIFFPRELGGINTSRAARFGDRIDHALYDLKRYYDKKPCRLASAYALPKTQRWLQSFNDFHELVVWMEIDGVLIDDNDEVFDLEKNDGSVICDYYEKYTRTWSESYYHNVKEKIKPLIRD